MKQGRGSQTRARQPPKRARVAQSARATWSASFVSQPLRSGISGRARACASCKTWLVSALERAADVDSRSSSGSTRRDRARGRESGRGEVARELRPREPRARPRARRQTPDRVGASRPQLRRAGSRRAPAAAAASASAFYRELGNDAGLGWVTFLLGLTLFDEGRFEEARDDIRAGGSDLHGAWTAMGGDERGDRQSRYALIADGEDEPRASDSRRGSADGSRSPVPGVDHARPCSAAARSRSNRSRRGGAAAWRGSGRLVRRARASDPRLHGLVSEAMERQARERLGERFEREWETGSDLTLEEAVALALDEE